MRKTLAPILALTLLSFAAAGVAWTGQAAVETPESSQVSAHASQPAPRMAPSTGKESLDDVSLEELLDGGKLGALPQSFHCPGDPTCPPCPGSPGCDGRDPCVACRDQLQECTAGCPPLGDPNYELCRSGCFSQFEDCRQNCGV